MATQGVDIKYNLNYTNFLKIFLACHARSIAFYKISVLEIKNLGMQCDLISPLVGSILFYIFGFVIIDSQLPISKLHEKRKHT